MEISSSSSRFSKEEDEEEEQEHEEEEEDDEASPREIPFMTSAAAAVTAATTASASTSSPPSASGSAQRFRDGAGASGRGTGADDIEVIEKEHMFDKVVTPSDVGKLNRLVIPKQHAEKYFPLDASANEKGLLLSFEDRTGKPWRFRYSYWNSSQSYVMTKGWSRFVKEKRLDAGDTVSFGRGVGEHARGRLFIDWRRRPDPPAPYHHHRFPLPSVPFAPWPAHYPAAGIGGTSSMLHLPPSPYEYADSHHHRRHDAYYYGPINTRKLHFYRPHQQATLVLDSVPVRIPTTTAPGHAETPSSVGSSGTKRLRLFGVNLDCAGSEEENQAGRTSAPPQLPSPPSSSSSSSGKPRCSLNLDL